MTETTEFRAAISKLEARRDSHLQFAASCRAELASGKVFGNKADYDHCVWLAQDHSRRATAVDVEIADLRRQPWRALPSIFGARP
jgi:hypothetical protein